MANENLQQGLSKHRQGKAHVNEFKYIPTKEKVEYEIREVIRAYPEDYPRIKQSLEEWAKQFD